MAAFLLGPAAAPVSSQTVPREVDPFYLDRLRDGQREYAGGNHARAKEEFELACFGLLERPELLAECLTRLALAQADLEDREGFRTTFRRLAEVEARFRGYSQAELPAELRSRFEERLAAWLTEGELATLPAFAPLAERRLEASLAKLPPRQRRERLAERVAEDPGDSRWRLMLASLELAEGRPEAALEALDAAAGELEGDAEAHCLRGLALAATARCRPALEDLVSCSAGDPEGIEVRLRCLVDLQLWGEAAELLSALAPDLRQRREIARLARAVEKGGGVGRPAQGIAEGNGEPGAEAAPTESRLDPPAASLSAEAQAQLDRARELLGRAQVASDLDEPLRLAAGIADAFPTSREAQLLAAEIAYRGSRWQTAADYFRRAGDPGAERPMLLFYMAVTFYETGDREAAAALLQRCLPRLEKTPFVERYSEKILGSGGATP